MKKIKFIVLIAIFVISFSSCENKDNTDNSVLIQENDSQIWKTPADFFYNYNIKNRLSKARRYVCNGYYIKNGETYELGDVYFDDLDKACAHIEACIFNFPSTTWVVNINGESWENSCQCV